MSIKEIEVRMKEIRTELDNEDADVEALSTEFESLKEERQKHQDKEERKKAMIQELESGEGELEIEEVEEKEERSMINYDSIEEVVKSDVYARAFSKTIIAKAKDERPNLTEDEKRALNTTNGAVLIPQVWYSEIVDQIKETHPILQDMTWQSIDAIVNIPRRLSIVSGDAAVMEEGTCPVGEENEFDSIDVQLIEIQKMVELTAKAGLLLPEAFKNWLVAEVRDRIGSKMASELVKAIKADILEENQLTAASAGVVDLADLLALYGSVDGEGAPKVYANRKTVFGNLYSITGADGRTAYVPNMQDALSGNLLGYQIRQETAVPDGEVLIVFPNEVFFNVPKGIRVKQMEDECFKLKISGIAFMGARLKYRKAAAVLSVSSAPGA